MKKKARGGREPVQEIVSLNDELFSFVTGDPLAALDERLVASGAGPDSCGVYTCSGFGSCSGFSCGTFKIV
jgi:hypothetical protein